MRRFTAILLLVALVVVVVLCLIPINAQSESEVVSNETLVSSGTVLIEPEPTPVPKTVHIEWEGGSLPAVVTVGTQLKIVSRLIGFENVEDIAYVWQVDRHDGLGFVPIENETQSYLVIVATQTSLSYEYRLTVLWN